MRNYSINDKAAILLSTYGEDVCCSLTRGLYHAHTKFRQSEFTTLRFCEDYNYLFSSQLQNKLLFVVDGTLFIDGFR